MSRQIKFRIWNGMQFVIKNNIYIKTCDGSLYDYDKDYGGTFSSNEILWAATGIIQQYTGLKDKNGVEIYEGDIVHYVFDGASYPKEAEDKFLICKWDQSNAWFVFDESLDKQVDGYYWLEIKGRCGVIGNIFENKELLEK